MALIANAQQYRDCAVDLSTIDSYVKDVASRVSRWQPSDGYGAALRIHATEQKVEGLIEEATSTCKFGSEISTSQADTILNGMDPLVSNIESALSAVIQKKPAFDSVPLVTPLVSSDIQHLYAKTYGLENTLLSDVPDSRREKATTYMNRINSAFSAVYRTYGLY